VRKQQAEVVNMGGMVNNLFSNS